MAEKERSFEEQRKELINKENKKDILVDLEKNREVTIPREVKTWMQKVEEDPSTQNSNQKIKGDDDSVLQPVARGVVKVTLPSDKGSFTTGFSKPVDSAWRWLSEFILRVIKRNKGNVKFKEE